MTQERFISLVRAEQEPLRRFLLALCGGDAALADDIAQDALVRAYVASGSFLGLSKFSTIDHCRKAKPEQTSVDDALEIPAAESSDSAFRYQQLYRAMDRLPEKEKASISLFYFEDRSIKEIAAILGIPQGTVKYHLSMGRTHLKQHIQL